jgi:L-arabinose isomerase
VKSKYKELMVGLVGLGLEAYWDQFEGLEQRLLGYLSVVEQKINGDHRRIVNLGLVDTPEKGLDAGHACRQHDVELLLVYVTTYALSSTVLPVILRAKVPVILLNLQPTSAIDYTKFNRMTDRTAMTSEWLAYCSACPVPEITNVLKRLDIPFQQVTGLLNDDPECWGQVEQWLKAAEVVHSLSHNRLGLMGHYYSGMLDIAADLTQICGRFGVHVEMLEVDELSELRRNVTTDEVKEKIVKFHEFFEMGNDCAEIDVHQAAQTSVALDRLIAANDLDLMAYYYKGSGVQENSETMSSIILGTSMLTGAGIPIAGEYEVKNAVAMKIMDLLGAGGSFTEYYAIDFSDDVILMGHDGPGHVKIAQDKVKVRPLGVYHGKVGNGLSVEMSVKHGPVTLLSVVEDKHRGFTLLVAEGLSVGGEILEIGNTNSRYRFSLGARRFVEAWNSHGPAHHCAVGVGHIATQIQKVAQLLDLGFEQVC